MTISPDMEVRTQYPRDPADNIIVLAAVVLALVLGFLAMLDWAPLSSPRAQSSAAAGECRRCGVVESVSSLDTARIESGGGVAIRGFGDELMSVLALVAAALTGNLHHDANKAAIQEVTVRFEDGTTRVFRVVGGPGWQSGNRVKVIQGRIYASS